MNTDINTVDEYKIVNTLIKKLSLDCGSSYSDIGYTEGIHVEVDDGSEYYIYTNKTRKECAKDYILDTIEFFRPDFLSRMTGIDEDAFEGISEFKGANKIIYAIVNTTCGIDVFVDEAINVDGYGHYLSPYDGEEIVLEVNDGWQRYEYYAYRVN